MASTKREAIIEYLENYSPTTTAETAEDVGCSKSYAYHVFRELLDEGKAVEFGSNVDGETLWSVVYDGDFVEDDSDLLKEDLEEKVDWEKETAFLMIADIRALCNSNIPSDVFRRVVNSIVDRAAV